MSHKNISANSEIKCYRTHCTAKLLKIRTPEKITVINKKIDRSEFSIKYSDRMANSVDPDQTVDSDNLISVYAVCPGLSVRKLRIIMVL